MESRTHIFITHNTGELVGKAKLKVLRDAEITEEDAGLIGAYSFSACGSGGGCSGGLGNRRRTTSK